MALTGHVIVGLSKPLFISSAATLPANAYDTVIAALSAAAALTLPALTDVPHGYTVLFRNNSAAANALTVTATGTNVYIGSGTSTTAAVAQNQCLIIVADRTNTRWQILLGPA